MQMSRKPFRYQAPPNAMALPSVPQPIGQLPSAKETQVGPDGQPTTHAREELLRQVGPISAAYREQRRSLSPARGGFDDNVFPPRSNSPARVIAHVNPSGRRGPSPNRVRSVNYDQATGKAGADGIAWFELRNVPPEIDEDDLLTLLAPQCPGVRCGVRFSELQPVGGRNARVPVMGGEPAAVTAIKTLRRAQVERDGYTIFARAI